MRHQDTPVLITGAAVSFEEEFAARRKRYSLIMALRIPCLVLAGVFGIALGWTWVAVALIVASVPLPWIAVLIANDAPPRKAEKPSRYRPDDPQLGSTTRALGPATHEVVDMPDDRVA
ncbi:DUF3099 domain-containing protein [Actinomycetospora termitidis]|uniref:DUF3099 domain-containing protein n=1 Tax=Actinomycetospora termitidis TaxID=3053470 RepID=A0ABT7MD07_9PSEU|nr:DUF3099 domain-containing protein [Actinomycetospora sp. Odt1-22]MDL5158551.1 DUF3099 domain-containing protein [Actinomycetospora sp. Odt1-22]